MGRTHTLAKFVNQGERLSSLQEIENWQSRVDIYLQESEAYEAMKKFREIDYYHRGTDAVTRQIGLLEALMDKVSGEDSTGFSEVITKTLKINLTNKRIFVVHGHDNEAKESVCRFIEKLGLEAIVLHEKANEGLTIIEKFERHADVVFAVVLLTPDDKGASINDLGSLRFRARQNVVLELGYFLGSLGRSRACALYKSEVEIPSDYQGVLYVHLDEAGAWRNKVAQELIRAKIEIDLNALVQ